MLELPENAVPVSVLEFVPRGPLYGEVMSHESFFAKLVLENAAEKAAKASE